MATARRAWLPRQKFKQADELEVLATNELREPVNSSPALAGTQMFLRGEKHIWCIEEK